MCYIKQASFTCAHSLFKFMLRIGPKPVS